MTRLDDATLDLLWSLWSELGVPGQERRHRAVAIDPEPLIAWTPFLAERDPRLLGLAFDWCVAHSGQIAKTRFPGLAARMPERAASALAAFNGALVRHGVDWRPRAAPAALDRGRAKMTLPMERPALVRFRLRALCGTAGRAEVFAALLAVGQRAAQAAELTPAGLTRRSVERLLGELAEAHLVAVEGGARRRTFRLNDRRALESLVHGAGLRWPDWHRALSLPAQLVELSAHASQSPGLRRVEAARAWPTLTGLGQSLGLAPPRGTAERADSFEALLDWGASAVAKL